jgi:hypothetical protein
MQRDRVMELVGFVTFLTETGWAKVDPGEQSAQLACSWEQKEYLARFVS